MDNRRVIGPGSGVVKYDILTAITIAGLNGSARDQIAMMRLCSLITARYNWRRDELSIGQQEMALLWGVGSRTVKREVKRWLETGILVCTRQGVRGRVAAYCLNMLRVCEMTEQYWSLLGQDFVDRMRELKPGGDRVIRLDAVRATRREEAGTSGWEAVNLNLEHQFPTQHGAWIAPLIASEANGELVLEAKSAFAAEYIKTHFGRDIADAVAAEWGAPRRISIRGPSSVGFTQK
ncbi:MAG: DnaA N-terminal domain-containing protein [Boseongicola sp.]